MDTIRFWSTQVCAGESSLFSGGSNSELKAEQDDGEISAIAE